MYNHVLTDKGLEIFDEDWKGVVNNFNEDHNFRTQM